MESWQKRHLKKPTFDPLWLQCDSSRNLTQRVSEAWSRQPSGLMCWRVESVFLPFEWRCCSTHIHRLTHSKLSSVVSGRNMCVCKGRQKLFHRPTAFFCTNTITLLSLDAQFWEDLTQLNTSNACVPACLWSLAPSRGKPASGDRSTVVEGTQKGHNDNTFYKLPFLAPRL